MGLLENSIGAMFGQGPGGNDGPSFGASPYGPLAGALIAMVAAKAMSGGLGNLGGGLGGILGGGQNNAPQPAQIPAGQAGGHDNGGGLLGGLGGLLGHLQQGGLGQAAQSWVGNGPNQTVQPNDLHQALGPDMVRELAQRMGISESEVVQRLSQELPQVVSGLTPNGRLPTQDEANSFLNGGNPLQSR